MIYFSSWWQTNTQWFLVFPKQIYFRNNKPERTANTRIIPLSLTQDTIAPQLQINMCVLLNNESCFTYSHLHGTILHWILEDLVVLWQGLGWLFSKYIQAYALTMWATGLMLRSDKVDALISFSIWKRNITEIQGTDNVTCHFYAVANAISQFLSATCCLFFVW